MHATWFSQSFSCMHSPCSNHPTSAWRCFPSHNPAQNKTYEGLGGVALGCKVRGLAGAIRHSQTEVKHRANTFTNLEGGSGEALCNTQVRSQPSEGDQPVRMTTVIVTPLTRGTASTRRGGHHDGSRTSRSDNWPIGAGLMAHQSTTRPARTPDARQKRKGRGNG